ncbi:MAG TPA: hypothetical protein VIX18_01135 [Nitrospirota bacterium]
MNNKDQEEIMRTFATRRARQLLAIALTVTAMIVLATVSKYPDFFGAISRRTVTIVMVLIILAFINFSSYNWRCPSCGRYLGSDITRTACRKCGSRLR